MTDVPDNEPTLYCFAPANSGNRQDMRRLLDDDPIETVELAELSFAYCIVASTSFCDEAVIALLVEDRARRLRITGFDPAAGGFGKQLYQDLRAAARRHGVSNRMELSQAAGGTAPAPDLRQDNALRGVAIALLLSLPVWALVAVLAWVIIA